MRPPSPGIVTESKLVLLTAPQANQLKDEVLGQKIVTLFGKPTDGEDGGLMSQGTIMTGLFPFNF